MSNSELSALHDRCMSTLLACSSNISNHLDSKTKFAEIETLKNLVDGYCEFDYRNKVYKRNLDAYAKNPNSLEKLEDDNGLGEFKNNLNDMVSALKKPQIHPNMEEFNKRTKPDDSEENLDDSDLITTECIDNFIDPLTKMRIKNPVKNKVCGHIYEASSMKQMIKQNARTKCPVMGCGNRNFIKITDLVVDERSKQKLTQTQKENEVNSDPIHEILDSSHRK